MKRAAVVLALALAACADPAAVTPRDDAAYAADHVVLRVFDVYAAAPHKDRPRVPGWTLYGDGRIVTLGPMPAIYPGYALPNVQVERVDTATVDRIAREARAAGVDGVDRDYGTVGAAETTTVFRLADHEGTAEARVPGLGHFTDENDDSEARKRLRAFYLRLTDLDGWLGAGTASAHEQYEITAIAVFAEPYGEGEEDIREQELTWDGPDPAKGSATAAGACTVLTGAALAGVLPDLRRSNDLTRWRHGGKDWAFVLRPLLPDESGCADLHSQ